MGTMTAPPVPRLAEARSQSIPAVRRAATVVLACAILLSATGCAQITDAFDAITGRHPASNVPSAAPESQGSTDAESTFTSDGSVQLSTVIADGLELRLDVWAIDPKRTTQWTTSDDKHLGYAVNAYDHHVDEKAVLTQKRQVFISAIQITSQTSQTSGDSQQPFQFSADPRTLVPTDTIRSPRGLLLNSYQGGLLVPDTVIGRLPSDTVELTLTFRFQISVQQSAGADAAFGSETVSQTVPIGINPGG